MSVTAVHQKNKYHFEGMEETQVYDSMTNSCWEECYYVISKNLEVALAIAQFGQFTKTHLKVSIVPYRKGEQCQQLQTIENKLYP